MVEAIKYSASGEQIGKVELPSSLFEVECNNPQALLYEVINMYLANQRHGTVAKKNRAMVSGSGKKLYKQKGTGNARLGNRRTNVRVGGGRAFPMDPKDWWRPIPIKKKRLALKLVLSDRAKAGKVVIVESLQFAKPSTKQAKELLAKITPEKGLKLLVTDGHDMMVTNSFNNLEGVETDRADGLFAYEILKSQCVILTEDALRKMEEVFAK